jgi:hypothetical protein
MIDRSAAWLPGSCSDLPYGEPLVIPKASGLLRPCTGIADRFSTIALGRRYGTVAVRCKDLYSYKSLRDYKYAPIPWSAPYSTRRTGATVRKKASSLSWLPAVVNAQRTAAAAMARMAAMPAMPSNQLAWWLVACWQLAAQGQQGP